MEQKRSASGFEEKMPRQNERHSVTSPVKGPRRAAESSPARDLFTQYLDEMKAYPVPNAEQELVFARRIESLEVAYWQALLAYPAALEPIRAAIKEHLREPKAFSALRKLPKVQGSARARAERAAAVHAAARQLRQKDVTRAALNAASAAVTAAFSELAGARRYLQRVESARRAQQQAKNRFMQANLRLVVSLARRYDQRLLPLADLIQEGNLGLMRAVERFDHSKGFRFSTYASWWIRHGFNRALSDRGRLVRVPVHLLDDAQRVAKQHSALTAATGQAPSARELAEKTGLSEEKLTFIATHAMHGAPMSLDKPLNDDGEATLLDIVPSEADSDPSEALDAARWSHRLDTLLSVLSPIEAATIRMRFGLGDGEELTLAEIGAKYNLSRERIRQLQAQALDKLRARLEEAQKSDAQRAA